MQFWAVRREASYLETAAEWLVTACDAVCVRLFGGLRRRRDTKRVALIEENLYHRRRLSGGKRFLGSLGVR